MTALKTIILSIIGLALVFALWFYLYTSHEKDMRLINAQETYTKYNDSLDYLVKMRELDVDTLMFRKQVEQTNRTNYATNKTIRDGKIYQATADANRQSNDNFILNFEPKYK